MRVRALQLDPSYIQRVVLFVSVLAHQVSHYSTVQNQRPYRMVNSVLPILAYS